MGDERPLPIGARGAVILAIVAAGAAAVPWLGLTPGSLVPSDGGLTLVGEFLVRAASPALTSEADPVPEGTPPLLWRALAAARTTVVFAAAAMSLALVLGLVLGFASSSAWWADDLRGRGRLRRVVAPVLTWSSRTLMVLMRSVHELLWAVLFLAALGRSPTTAVIAIAIPYGGTLAKVFSEMIDEAPRDAAHALRSSGASPAAVFVFGLLPRALPDMIAYSLYRFECALRSAAILGFFGFPTLGYYLKLSFENLHYGEVWTYLYTLFALIVVVDWWSGALRRRFLA